MTNQLAEVALSRRWGPDLAKSIEIYYKIIILKVKREEKVILNFNYPNLQHQLLAIRNHLVKS